MRVYHTPYSLRLHDNMKRHILWIALTMRNTGYYRQFLSSQIFLLFLAILYSALELFIQMMVSIPRQYCDNYWNIYAYVIVATGWILWKGNSYTRSYGFMYSEEYNRAPYYLDIIMKHYFYYSFLLIILLITNEGSIMYSTRLIFISLLWDDNY